LAARGNVLLALKRFAEAVASFKRAAAIDPSFKRPYARALSAYAAALSQTKSYDEALKCYEQAIAIQPDFADGHLRRAAILYSQGRFLEARTAYEQYAAFEQHKGMGASLAHHTAQTICDWKGRTERIDNLFRIMDAGYCVEPFVLLHSADRPEVLLEAARARSLTLMATAISHPRERRNRNGTPITLGYISADFRPHVVASATAELFESHDRSRFEVHGFALSAYDGSEIASRLEGAFDRFHAVNAMSDRDIAETIHDNNIDILIDLMGHTALARPNVFSGRPAPIVASYFGYPGTTGNETVDYLIADRYVIPEDAQRFYSECIAYLPDTYFISDSRRATATVPALRRDYGLPETGIVFCCFNQGFKFTPEMMDVWARLLSNIDKSVLWFNVTHKDAVQNLRNEAAARGIASERLIFSPFVDKMEEHLARLSLADLFLDTLPYNAHSTAYDALWAGLPVLTLSGHTFAARVAGSLLMASGLPELITHSIEDYEALALKLAREPYLLQNLRRKLAINRTSHPLFDSHLTYRHLEAAYETMWSRQRAGLSPETFVVERLGIGA
jgi:predicted O-linked N-acetylglucosamine transferase (SPINDLY family)